MMKHIKKMLMEEQTLLLEQMADIHRQSSAVQKEIGDTIDASVEEQVREFQLLLQERNLKKLSLIKDALGRMETDEYGYCEECEEPISQKRLKVMPFVRLCIDCQSEQERLLGKIQVSLEDSRVFGED